VREYIVPRDLASKRDRYAEIVLRDMAYIEPGAPAILRPGRVMHEYVVIHFKQGERMRYDEMEDSLVALCNSQTLKHKCDLLVDGTGVGDAVVEGLRKRGLYPVSIIFTSGGRAVPVFDSVERVFGRWSDDLGARAQTIKEWRVPKRDLVSDGALLLQQFRIKVSKGLEHREIIKSQLNGFRGKVNDQTGKKKFEAELEELHDDAVVCYLMGAWWIWTFGGEIPERELRNADAGNSETWEPMAMIDKLMPEGALSNEYGPGRSYGK